VDTCSHCGVELPEKATFCPACGRRTDAPPPDPAVLPIVLRPEEPRYFGLSSPPFVLSIAVGVIVVGIVLVVLGALVPGLIAIVAGVCLIPSFLAGVRRWPKTPVARASLSTARRVRGEAGAAVESVSTWSKAGRDLVRHRRQQFQLRRERDARIRELGVSAYAEDGRADELKAAAKELDSRIEANERTMQRTIAGARRRVRKERAAVVTTEVIAPAPDEDEDEAPKT
jgi:zinc ribbon protein